METTLEPLPGALVRDFKRCGHPHCKCARGELHGPYFVRVWYEAGKRRKSYVKPGEVERVRAAIQLFEVVQHLHRLRFMHAQSIGRKRRAWVLEIIEQFERDAEAIKARFTLGEQSDRYDT